MGIKEVVQITNFVGAAIVHGFAKEAIELNQVLAFDLRFNLHQPGYSALYLLEVPINGCHFELVCQDGRRFHVGNDVAAQILGKEKQYMSTLEQIAEKAKEQSGLVKKFCRKCDLFGKIFPDEAREEAARDRQKAMEEAYIDRAGGIMARLAEADRLMPIAALVTLPVEDEKVVPSAVSHRIRRLIKANCEVSYALPQEALNAWANFLNSKQGQVFAKAEIWNETDPTGLLRFSAADGKIKLSRAGTVVGDWNDYGSAFQELRLGTGPVPNAILPLTMANYANILQTLGIDESIVKSAIRSQVTSAICDENLRKYLSL